MKIIKLTAENIKRLKAVEISPDGTVQVITGRNAQGKTSVLDAIWLALGGGAALRETARPIRDGEESASVVLDLGDLTVTRTWKGSKTTLTVASPEGARFSSPQSVLDALIGRLSFDPLEFTRLSPREQVAALIELVDLDIDPAAIAVERQRLYDERTDVGRRGKALGESTVRDDLPLEEKSATALLRQIQEAREYERRRDAVDRSIREAESEIAKGEAALADWKGKLSAREVDLAKIPENTLDVDAAEAQLATLEDVNAAIRANNAAVAREQQRAELRAEYEALGAKIDELDERKAQALAQAKFPVDGLAFDEVGVTYNGIPFSQSSSAEQIRISLAMAMNLNPELRVIRILDGSLLDADNLKLITDMATAEDYQVWIERVADGSGVGVVIEDGEVI